VMQRRDAPTADHHQWDDYGSPLSHHHHRVNGKKKGELDRSTRLRSDISLVSYRKRTSWGELDSRLPAPNSQLPTPSFKRPKIASTALTQHATDRI
jgi:hypothetical protein